MNEFLFPPLAASSGGMEVSLSVYESDNALGGWFFGHASGMPQK